MVDNEPQIIIDTKGPSETLSRKYLLQVVSYAKLVRTPVVQYAFVTNGTDLLGMDPATGKELYEIPSKNELIAEMQRSSSKEFTEIELNEVKRTLITILDPNSLYNVINKCKLVIENQALIRSDQSFKKMTKIILVKMNEERRATVERKQNRFSRNYLEKAAEVNESTPISIFKKLFEEATKKYKGIYTNPDDAMFKIQDNHSLVKVVELLEPYSFLGTGEDIKGMVYETFLKANLRGDFDQYFTPRQIVEFMVKIANPQYKEKFVDPAAGSGGFLIQAFNYVSRELKTSQLPSHDYEIALDELVKKDIWGQEADYDLHILTKINMIMHGDGWNNIKQGDSLKTNYLPENYFDLVLENPPFTIPYDNREVLDNYELGRDRKNQELDILFIEKSLNLLREGGRMLIIIPEGLLNLKSYKGFREWLLRNSYIKSVYSLPAGAFQPFGRSASKTAIIEVVKKGKSIPANKYIFAATVENIGYALGKSEYREIKKNDFAWISNQYNEYFDGIHDKNNSKCGWIEYKEVFDSSRIDAGGLLSLQVRTKVKNIDKRTVKLGNLYDISSPSTVLEDDTKYNYVQVPYFSDDTGALTKVECVLGKNINSKILNKIDPGGIYFTRINPRKRRIGLVPTILKDSIYVSNEVYSLTYKENNYFTKEEQYLILPILRSKLMTTNITLMGTGSSSSRARVSIDNVRDLEIPVWMIEKERKKKYISQNIEKFANNLFNTIYRYIEMMDSIMLDLDKLE